MATSQRNAVGSLAATGASTAVHGRKVDVHLSGTWAGTVVVRIYSGAGTAITPSTAAATMTANDVVTIDMAQAHDVDIHFTRTSGTVVYELTTSD